MDLIVSGEPGRIRYRLPLRRRPVWSGFLVRGILCTSIALGVIVLCFRFLEGLGGDFFRISVALVSAASAFLGGWLLIGSGLALRMLPDTLVELTPSILLVRRRTLGRERADEVPCAEIEELRLIPLRTGRRISESAPLEAFLLRKFGALVAELRDGTRFEVARAYALDYLHRLAQAMREYLENHGLPLELGMSEVDLASGDRKPTFDEAWLPGEIRAYEENSGLKITVPANWRGVSKALFQVIIVAITTIGMSAGLFAQPKIDAQILPGREWIPVAAGSVTAIVAILALAYAWHLIQLGGTLTLFELDGGSLEVTYRTGTGLQERTWRRGEVAAVLVDSRVPMRHSEPVHELVILDAALGMTRLARGRPREQLAWLAWRLRETMDLSGPVFVN